MSIFSHYTFQIPLPIRLFSFRLGESPKYDKNISLACPAIVPWICTFPHFHDSFPSSANVKRLHNISFTKLNMIHFLQPYYSRRRPALLICAVRREHRKHAGPLHHPILSLWQQHTWTKINFMDFDLVCGALSFSSFFPQPRSGHIMMTSSFKAEKNPGKCTRIQLPMPSQEFHKFI